MTEWRDVLPERTYRLGDVAERLPDPDADGPEVRDIDTVVQALTRAADASVTEEDVWAAMDPLFAETDVEALAEAPPSKRITHAQGVRAAIAVYGADAEVTISVPNATQRAEIEDFGRNNLLGDVGPSALTNLTLAYCVEGPWSTRTDGLGDAYQALGEFDPNFLSWLEHEFEQLTSQTPGN